MSCGKAKAHSLDVLAFSLDRGEDLEPSSSERAQHVVTTLRPRFPGRAEGAWVMPAGAAAEGAITVRGRPFNQTLHLCKLPSQRGNAGVRTLCFLLPQN